MDIREEDFPLYTILVDENQFGVQRLRDAFNAAVYGGDDDKYSFALGMNSVVFGLPDGALPEATEEVKEKTLQSCRAVFEYLADRGHSYAAQVLDYYNENGIGLKFEKPAPVIQPPVSRLKPGKYKM